MRVLSAIVLLCYVAADVESADNAVIAKRIREVGGRVYDSYLPPISGAVVSENVPRELLAERFLTRPEPQVLENGVITVSFAGCDLKNEDLAVLREATQMRSLVLSGSSINDDGITH